MNQTDMIQKIIAAEHQANQLTENAKSQSENMEASIQTEIEALRTRYQANADAYLERLEQAEQARSTRRLKELDDKLDSKLKQVEIIYQARKDEWIEAIFDRIVGKAGG